MKVPSRHVNWVPCLFRTFSWSNFKIQVLTQYRIKFVMLHFARKMLTSQAKSKLVSSIKYFNCWEDDCTSEMIHGRIRFQQVC